MGRDGAGMRCTEERGGSPSIIPWSGNQVLLRYSFLSVPFAFALGGKNKKKEIKTELKMLEGVSEVANLVCHPMRALLS